jgi:ABC-2 type transport system permease protein
MMPPFPYLLLPSFWSTRNRTRRRERGDLSRAVLFGLVGLLVCGALLGGTFWLTSELVSYEEFGDYLLRLGLSWLFLTFLSFLAFSAVVTALSTFFLSDDLRILIPAPVAARRLFYARFVRTACQASWMVVVFMVPALAGIGLARCAPASFYLSAAVTIVPFVVIPVAIGAGVTLLLVNVFPARRARDILMLMGLVFAAGLVILLRFMRPERLMSVESLPDITDFFSTIQSPITPLLPSFWAGEALFAQLRGAGDPLHVTALWTTALGLTVLVAAAYERWHFTGYSKAQEGRKVRLSRLTAVEAAARLVPMSIGRRHLLIKDLKVFLRDVSQWSQLLLLLALVLVYLYNFRVLDLGRIPYMGGVLKNAYAFVNLGMAGFVMATVAVRFVFPGVSSEGAAFWIIRTAPIPMRDFLWSKFWTGLVPVLLLTEVLTVVANQFLDVDPFAKIVAAVAVVFMAFAMVGLATGLGARYPRFAAENPTQVAGSYGGITFMTMAVLYVIVMMVLLGWPTSVYLMYRVNARALPAELAIRVGASFAIAGILSLFVWWYGMRTGVRALEEMDRTPS